LGRRRGQQRFGRVIYAPGEFDEAVPNERRLPNEQNRAWFLRTEGVAGIKMELPVQMRLRQAVVSTLKPSLFRDELRPTKVCFGVGRGLVFMLNRRHALQRWLGIEETESQRIFRRFVARGNVVFDVGAYDGDTALQLAKLAVPGRVVAFEPNPSMRRLLEENAALNPQLPPLQVVPSFAGAQDDGDRIVTLDSFVARGKAPPPNFVKIDVDGAELDVLSGMEQIMKTVRPVVLVEVHSADLEGSCDVFLSRCGYDVRIIKNVWWRVLYPEWRPIKLNRWLLAVPRSAPSRPSRPDR
jgi:hypothetical protein